MIWLIVYLWFLVACLSLVFGIQNGTRHSNSMLVLRSFAVPLVVPFLALWSIGMKVRAAF